MSRFFERLAISPCAVRDHCPVFEVQVVVRCVALYSRTTGCQQNWRSTESSARAELVISTELTFQGQKVERFAAEGLKKRDCMSAGGLQRSNQSAGGEAMRLHMSGEGQ